MGQAPQVSRRTIRRQQLREIVPLADSTRERSIRSRSLVAIPLDERHESAGRVAGVLGVTSVNINPHAHFGDTAHACRRLPAIVWVGEISIFRDSRRAARIELT
jgi:hypothetical protein